MSRKPGSSAVRTAVSFHTPAERSKTCAAPRVERKPGAPTSAVPSQTLNEKPNRAACCGLAGTSPPVSLRPTLLAVHLGSKDDVAFATEPSIKIPIPDSSLFQSIKSAAEDLNGDHLSDIILHYIGAGRRPDRVILLLSRKK